MSDTDKGLGAWLKSWFLDPVRDPVTKKGTVSTIEDKKFEMLQSLKDSGLDYDEQEYLRLKELLGKAGGGMMNMDEMIRPIGYTFGGSVDELGTGLKKLKLQKLAGGLGLSENALDELDILDSMSVIEIDALFDKMIGGE